ncbi:hypothetical protein BGZ61DRAFT_491579 [Ilyonectria robusta]|uniref:uncharacterized protein n=1 Tax=Ilyonectria robusta TaxID=1079257 RepID=UPI001E8D5473|nr:uncharacterized protein BGZ61DRAFT_491579 [Ilyonectria robusta]KAH8734169.1 hypothetical protein BGZ61DRAFT_491579 [Ilyonectria robusta]
MRGKPPGPKAILVRSPIYIVKVSGWILILIATAVIIARLNLRLNIQHRRILISDVLMCGAWLSAVCLNSMNIVLTRHGALEPQVKTTMEGFTGDAEELSFVLEMFWFISIPFYMTLYFSKAALLSMYLQIFPNFMRKRRMFLWATIIYVALSFAASILLFCLICLPIETNWDLSTQSTCPVSLGNVVFITNWTLHITGDLLVFSLPWLIIPGLNMKRSLKVGVYSTFLLGIINIIFDTIRFATIKASAIDTQISISTIGLLIGLVVKHPKTLKC